MRKTSEFNIAEKDLTTDTNGLQQLLHSGRKTAVEVGTAAEARIQIGRRVLWNIPKVKEYLDLISK